MNKQYWTKKLKVLQIASKLKLTDTALMSILKRIATDQRGACLAKVLKLRRWGVRIVDEDQMENEINLPHPADFTFLVKDVIAAIRAGAPDEKN